jgi:hydrogenase/urease accessory protein HupE
MSAQTQIRLASLTAAAYGALLVSGAVFHFQRTGSVPALARSLSHPALWVALLLAAVITFGLWKRYAWAWWLAIAAAVFQGWRIVAGWFARGFAHVPGMPTLIALALLLVLLVLLLPRRSRLGCSR